MFQTHTLLVIDLSVDPLSDRAAIPRPRMRVKLGCIRLPASMLSCERQRNTGLRLRGRPARERRLPGARRSGGPCHLAFATPVCGGPGESLYPGGVSGQSPAPSAAMSYGLELTRMRGRGGRGRSRLRRGRLA